MKKVQCVILMIVFLMLPMGLLSHAEDINRFEMTADIRDSSESTIKISGTGITDLYAYEAKIEYDPQMVEVSKVVSNLQGFSVAPHIDGNILTIAFTKVGDVKGEKGTFLLSTVTFKSKRSGTSNIILKSVTVVDSTLSAQQYKPNISIAFKHKGTVYSQEAIASSDGNINTATLSENMLQKMLADTATDKKGVKTVEIELQGKGKANFYIQKIPASFFTSTIPAKQLIIRTPLGRIWIPDNMMMTEQLKGVQFVSIIIEKVNPSTLGSALVKQIGERPVIRLTAMLDTRQIQWNSPASVVKVSVPYHPAEREAIAHENIVSWYIDEEQNIHPVQTGRFYPEWEELAFVTNRFGVFTVNHVIKTFSDIQEHWCREYVEVMASKGIINGYPGNIFGCNDLVTRADYVTLLVRTLGITAEVNDNFEDVLPEKYYFEPIGIAKKLGIVSMDKNLFRPDEAITREDMMVYTTAILNYSNHFIYQGGMDDLKQYSDKDQIDPAAVESVAILVQEGIIQGDKNTLFPKNRLTRAEAATVLYRLFYKVWNNQ